MSTNNDPSGASHRHMRLDTMSFLSSLYGDMPVSCDSPETQITSGCEKQIFIPTSQINDSEEESRLIMKNVVYREANPGGGARLCAGD